MKKTLRNGKISGRIFLIIFLVTNMCELSKALGRLLKCLENNHLIEFITYQRWHDYNENCPPIMVCHCDDCGDEIAVTPLYEEDMNKVKEYFMNYCPVLDRETFKLIMRLTEKVKLANMFSNLYLDEKEAMRKVFTTDGKIHLAWKLKDEGGQFEKILVFEYIPENYPSVYLGTFNSLKEYEEATVKVDWLKEDS